ncbi:MAG: DUF255 domain-containing protein [Bacteroidota bacterium]|nr:DUF255 domain-containing protein [Bacteroidota bacterium]
MRIVSCILILFLSLELYSQQKGIIFQEESTFESVLNKAQKENKIIFLDGYDTSCPYSRNLTNNIFRKKEVGDFFNQNFINVSFNSKGGEGIKIRQRYGIGYPFYLYLNSKGEIIHLYDEDKSADAAVLIENAKDALSASKNFKAIKQRIADGDYSISTITSYLHLDPQPANLDTLLNVYFQKIDNDKKMSEQSWKLFKNWLIDVDNFQFKYFFKHRTEFEQKFGKKETNKKIVAVYKAFIEHEHLTHKKGNISVEFIDSMLFKEAFLKFEYISAMDSFKENSKNNMVWKTYIQKAKDYLSYKLDTDELCYLSWKIYENYKTFNDINSLKLARDWSFISIQSEPDNSLYIDTYAHILFDLGYKREAITYEEKALKIALNNKDDFSQFCKNEIKKMKCKSK